MIRSITITLGFSVLLLLPRIGWGDEQSGLTVEIKQASSTTFNLVATTTVNSQFSVLVSLTLENLVPSTSQRLFNLSGVGQTTLLSLDMVDPNGGYSSRLGYQWNFGYSGTAHNNDYPYRIPYSTSESFEIGQEYFGTFSHQGEHALDWDTPEGTKILAARGGTVIAIKEDSNEAGTEERHEHMANYVTIGHDDGSQAIYVHLQMNGALVELGDWVTTGDVIGLSGNTGFSTGPHLHFKVSQQKSPADFASVPTLFVDKNGTALNLDEGGNLLSLTKDRAYEGSADANLTVTAQSIRKTTMLDGSTKWRTGSWLGTFYDPSQSWIYHPYLGWLYTVDSENSSIWLYHSTRGWAWTDQASFPWLYFHSSEDWKYFLAGAGLFNQESEQWEKLEP